MKTAKKISIVCLVLAFLIMPLSVYSFAKEKKELSNFIRLHIRANSYSDEDQALKLKVRDAVLERTTVLLEECSEKEEAYRILTENLNEIVSVADKVIKENGFAYSSSAYIDNEWFERREYDGFYLPQGNYDALIIELGSGKGHNWWCVLYPCVCLSGSSGNIETDTEKVPERFRTSSQVSEGDIHFDFWIIDFFKNLFK